tara:strand:+ start:195 stop:488 length:294 start_codon:yes stop_codon:yes gene_type:complete
MKITKSQLKQIIKEELVNTLKEWQTEPELAFEYGEVVLKTSEGEFSMSVEEFLNMKSPSWDPDVVEIEAASMEGRSVDIPKEMWTNAATRLKQAQGT